MNQIPQQKRLDILKLLIEGNSLSSVSRITGCHRDTCGRVLKEFGVHCQMFLSNEMRDLEIQHIEIDELWTFCRKKERRLTGEEPDYGKIGDIYIFIALDRASRLVPAFLAGRRNEASTYSFIADLYGRLKKEKPHASDDHAYQKGKIKPITNIYTDAFPAYPGAIDAIFGRYANYSQIVKRANKDGLTISKRTIIGDGKDQKIGTSLVERNNLTIRTFLRRLMRRTLAFSKKFEFLEAAAAVHIAHYNYCWKHKTLGTSPANAAGIAPRLFTLRELCEYVDKVEESPTVLKGYHWPRMEKDQ